MGVLIPANYDLRNLDKSLPEKRVVQLLRDQLSDSWKIIHRLDLATEKRPYEIDVLIFHEKYGVIGIEVKGGQVSLQGGAWTAGKRILKEPPAVQSKNSCRALQKKLRETAPSLENIKIHSAVAMPDSDDSEVDITPLDVVPESFFFQSDLQEKTLGPRLFDFLSKVANIEQHVQYSEPVMSHQQIQDFVNFVRPTISYKWDPEAQANEARTSLNSIVREQVRALSTLDMNNTVFVHGAAGTGKTHLVLNWANRALSNGERVLITCYNEPLADYLAKQFSEEQNIVVSAYLKIPENVEDFPELPVPNPTPIGWWDTAPLAHIKQHASQLVNKFDTIIVDETQDFNGEWINSLIELHDPDGSQSLLMVGDWQQNIFHRDGKDAVDALEPTEAELMLNCRNSHEIGRLLYVLGGAQVANASPDGQGLYFEYVSDLDSLVHWVGHYLEYFIGSLSHDPRKILIVTKGAKERDAIREAMPGGYVCSAYEDGQDENVVCETVFRAKGLEFDHVIFATTDANVDESLLYVGLSRAVSTLVVLAPAEITREKLQLVRNK
jgi:hypothetical protein